MSAVNTVYECFSLPLFFFFFCERAQLINNTFYMLTAIFDWHLVCRSSSSASVSRDGSGPTFRQ